MTASAGHRIEIQGVFDRRLAVRLGDLVGHLRRGGQLLVDLSRVREFHHTALGALASTLKHADQGVRVQVVGLCHQQLLLLRYLGWEPPRRSGMDDPQVGPNDPTEDDQAEPASAGTARH